MHLKLGLSILPLHKFSSVRIYVRFKIYGYDDLNKPTVFSFSQINIRL